MSSVDSKHSRYYLSAGAGPFRRPPWRFRQPAGALPDDRLVVRVVESILYCREAREAAIEQEIQAIRAAGPERLVMEVIGSPSHDDIAFWQACRLRVPEARLEIVRHAEPADVEQPNAPAAEVLLTLLLSGGYANADQLRRWDPDLVGELTSTREGSLYTYADPARRAQAWAAYDAAAPCLIAELAALVTSTQRQPLLATAALVDDPELALAAYSADGCADVAGDPALPAYGRNLFRTGRKSGWQGVSKQTAATMYLAAFVAARQQIAPNTAEAVLRLAGRFGVQPEARSLLANALGQHLTRSTDPEGWAAGVRCFDHVHSCLRAGPPADPESLASQTAAAYNGAALAHYRAGDHNRAVEAELSGLDALASPGVLEQGNLHEQQVLLLTNLAKVYGRITTEPARTLDCYRMAWSIASAAGSLAGLGYTASGLVRALLGAGDDAEAEGVVKELLGHYDAAPVPFGDAERSVVAVCWNLADAKLAEGSVDQAAAWYAEAVNRMHRAVPAVISGILRNLRAQPEPPPAAIVALLERKLAAHEEIAADLRSLLALAEGACDR